MHAAKVPADGKKTRIGREVEKRPEYSGQLSRVKTGGGAGTWASVFDTPDAQLQSPALHAPALHTPGLRASVGWRTPLPHRRASYPPQIRRARPIRVQARGGEFRPARPESDVRHVAARLTAIPQPVELRLNGGLQCDHCLRTRSRADPQRPWPFGAGNAPTPRHSRSNASNCWAAIVTALHTTGISSASRSPKNCIVQCRFSPATHFTSPATGRSKSAIFAPDRRISGDATTAIKVRMGMEQGTWSRESNSAEATRQAC